MKSKMIPKPLGDCGRSMLKVAPVRENRVCQRRQDRSYSGYCSRRKTLRVNWVQLPETETGCLLRAECAHGKVLKDVVRGIGSVWLGHLRLLTGAHWVRLRPSHREWGTRTLSFMMAAFEGMASRSLTKTFLGCRKYILKRQRKDLQLQVF